MGIPDRMADSGSVRQAGELKQMAGASGAAALSDPAANAFGVAQEEVPSMAIASEPGDAGAPPTATCSNVLFVYRLHHSRQT